MQQLMLDLLRFHRELQHPIGTWPRLRTLPQQDLDLRISLIEEEVNQELLPALRSRNLVGAADGMIDSIYVIVGTAVTMGLNLVPLWDEVQRANMAKAGGPIRADGKRLKPEGWQPPNIKACIYRQILSAPGSKAPSETSIMRLIALENFTPTSYPKYQRDIGEEISEERRAEIAEKIRVLCEKDLDAQQVIAVLNAEGELNDSEWVETLLAIGAASAS